MLCCLVFIASILPQLRDEVAILRQQLDEAQRELREASGWLSTVQRELDDVLVRGPRSNDEEP